MIDTLSITSCVINFEAPTKTSFFKKFIFSRQTKDTYKLGLLIYDSTPNILRPLKQRLCDPPNSFHISILHRNENSKMSR